jgi:glycine C-acetyltransferase
MHWSSRSSVIAAVLWRAGFSYPVVPKGQARIRVQMSAAHSNEDIDTAVAAFAKVGHAMNIIH